MLQISDLKFETPDYGKKEITCSHLINRMSWNNSFCLWFSKKIGLWGFETVKNGWFFEKYLKILQKVLEKHIMF